MKHQATSEWKGGMAFEHTIDGHTLITGSTTDGKIAGASPKKLLLASLAGCTGVDVVELLQKMRQPVERIRMEVEAEQTTEHPKIYSVIRLVYHIYGSDIKPDKVERAITLSQEKLCGVTAILQESGPVEYRYEIHEEASMP